MNANSVVGKINMIQSIVHTYSPDLVAITETKIDNNIQDNELLSDDFTLWRKDRNRSGGGVLIAVANKSKFVILDSKIENGECISLCLQIHPLLKIRVIVFYRPPSEQNLDDFELIVDEYKHENCILIGDMNFPDIAWSSDYTGVVKTNSSRKSFHENALEIINNADLIQLVHEPTHKLGNTLDLMLVNRSALNELYYKCDVLPYISDHKMLLADVIPQDYEKVQITSEPPSRPRYNFKKADYELIEQKFENFIDNIEDDSIVSIETLWNTLNETIKDSLSSIPRKLSRPKGHPWINRQIVRLIRKRDRMYKRNKRFPSITHYDEYIELCSLIKSRVRQAKTQYQNHLAEQMEEGNTKPLYNYLTKHSGRSNNINGLKDCSTDDIPDRFADHFSSVFTENQYQVPNFPPRPYPMMSDITVNSDGVKALIMKLDIRKAGGPDNITSTILKMFCMYVPSFLDAIVILITKSLEFGKVPKIWKSAVVSPVFKSGDRKDVNNYRAISLTCILSKLTEHIISSNMWRFINQNNIISDKQHGFRSGLNTSTQLLHVVHFAAQALDNKDNYHIISFDFSKAFDKVPHKLLLHKLISLRFNDKCVSWIADWLTNRTSTVSVNGKTSTEFQVGSGVPQGSVLGPLLFLLYINDMIDKISVSDCRLYADDTLLCVNLTKNPNTIQSDVNALLNWAKNWGMCFNSRKCVHIKIGAALPDLELKLDNEAIPQASALKYLGIQIDSSLKWNNHITLIVSKANRTLGMVKRGLKEAPIKTKLLAIKSLVIPILEYATQVWSPHNKNLIKNIEKVQRDGVKWAYRLKQRESVSNCMIDNGIICLSDRRDNIDIQFLRKIEAGDYKVRLKDYIQIETHDHNTRGKTVSWQHRVNPWRYSYYNRVRDKVATNTNPSNDH